MAFEWVRPNTAPAAPPSVPGPDAPAKPTGKENKVKKVTTRKRKVGLGGNASVAGGASATCGFDEEAAAADHADGADAGADVDTESGDVDDCTDSKPQTRGPEDFDQDATAALEVYPASRLQSPQSRQKEIRSSQMRQRPRVRLLGSLRQSPRTPQELSVSTSRQPWSSSLQIRRQTNIQGYPRR